MNRKRSQHVAVIVEMSNAFARGIMQGINSYIQEQRHWIIEFAERRRGDGAPFWMMCGHIDGILARIENKSIAKAVVQSRLPAVDLSTTSLNLGLPSVIPDESAVVLAAFEHLRERGFQRFAYYSDSPAWWSTNRCEHFHRMLASRGLECHGYTPRTRRTSRSLHLDEQIKLTKWVARLPKPIGILAGYDLSGHELLNACRRARVAVPEEVAVIGVHNDELVCELADPPLSSIMHDAYRIGFVAASLLDDLMAKRKVPTTPILIPPICVVARRSTDILAMADLGIANAVRFIRAHACEGIRVDDLVNRFKLSRRTFELRFRKHVGRTPHAEILRVQLDRTKQLLAETDLKMRAIAVRCGFRRHEYMNAVFRRFMGSTPGQYRAANRRCTPAPLHESARRLESPD